MVVLSVKRDLAAQFKPLHYLLEIVGAEVAVKGLGHRGLDDLARHRIGALDLAFVFQFQLAGDGGHGSVDIGDARHGDGGAFEHGAALGV